MSDVATGRAIPTAAPFSANYGLRAPERLAVGRMIEAAGLRWLPYRFGSALAVVSDVDASNRDRYAGYIGMLVEELGFDFGDSTWLLSERRSLGFFSPHLSLGRSEPSESYTNTRTFTESVAEFHKGNIDHFHAFSRHGPRVAVIDDVQTGRRRKRPDRSWQGRDPGSVALRRDIRLRAVYRGVAGPAHRGTVRDDAQP